MLVRLVRPGLDLNDYAETLSAMHPAQQGLEVLAAKSIHNLALAYPFTSRMDWLEADLAHLGLSSPASPGRGPEPPATLAELVGLLYVLEGSRLGARIIAKRVRASLGDGIPRTFFDNADGERAWPVFCDFAVTHCPMEEVELAIRAARQAFGYFLKHLDTSRVLDLSPTD
ncbi:biliverdin-producing heme oxygenase [Halomonas aquatica]|uniref:Biliverdin-producing heme oxygenase n=1 Tax=Halomonas aquatica TaxID=3151123 RepID=A0ABV1NF41_9GAMM